MIFTTLLNKGEQFVVTVGGRQITVKSGENWLPRGTGEFIMTKMGNCQLMSVTSKECEDDGTKLGGEKEETKKVEELKKVEDEKTLVVDKIVVEPDEIEHIVTKDEIKDNNLEGQVTEGDTILIPSKKEQVSEEDKSKYLEELQKMDRKKLIEIVQFKEIKFAKNASDEKLVKLIINSLE